MATPGRCVFRCDSKTRLSPAVADARRVHAPDHAARALVCCAAMRRTPLLAFSAFPALMPLTLLVTATACDKTHKETKTEPLEAPRDSAAALPTAASAPASASASVSLDVLAHASAPTADGGPRMVVSDAVDGAALRARNAARLAKASPVTVLTGGSARDLGERICREVIPSKPASTPFLIKPNIGGFDWFKDPKTHDGDDGVRGRITDPEFVRGIVRCLKARGHTRIVVAEGWGATHKDWLRLIKTSGYEAMTAEEGVPLIAMDDDGTFDDETKVKDAPGKPLAVRGMEKTGMPTLLVPKLLADTLASGVFISAPKVKAHRFGVVSMSVKGMQGTIMTSDAAPAFHNKWRTHRELGKWLQTKEDGRAGYVRALETFAERIADVLAVEAPDFVLADGAPMMNGDGFQKMVPSTESVAIGGANPILVDRVGAQLLGLWNNEELGRELGGHTTSPLIEVAAKRFGLDLSAPEVVGDGASLLDAPRPVSFVGMAGFTLESGVPGPAAAAKPEAHAAHVEGEGRAHEPVVDGRLDDAAWKAATPVTFDTDYAGNKTQIATTARLLWSKSALYIGWELSRAGLSVDRGRPVAVERAKLYEEDCVELFVTPDPTKAQHYYEVEMGPFGHFFDIDVDRAAKKQDTSWSSGLTIAATQDAAAHTATIEARVTAPEIVRALTPGAKLPFALYRMEGKDPRLYLAFSPPRTTKPNFHVPAAFGTLVLDR